MPQPKQLKLIDTAEIVEKFKLKDISMTFEQKVLSIVDNNEATLASGAAPGLNLTTQPKQFQNLY